MGRLLMLRARKRYLLKGRKQLDELIKNVNMDIAIEVEREEIENRYVNAPLRDKTEDQG